MRVVVQRVAEASVTVHDEVVGSIGQGLLVLVGVTHSDSERDAHAVADKLAGLRIFGDDAGLMNRSVTDVAGACLIVSQFTLYGVTKKGRRPSFTSAAEPQAAELLIDSVVDRLRGHGLPVETGVFGARMQVASINAGPVTLVIESEAGRIV
ncbi:MAG: D-tyrosyl-tRNA(Tyr) deacylase [Acidimicrobiia bacterium]|nr:D-tyrosyl-tRNA(Tyr) deacylase [Acidimicrobiia bacterium]